MHVKVPFRQVYTKRRVMMYIPKAIVDMSEVSKDLKLIFEFQSMNLEPILVVNDNLIEGEVIPTFTLTNDHLSKPHGYAYSSLNIFSGIIETYRFVRFASKWKPDILIVYKSGGFFPLIPLILKLVHKNKVNEGIKFALKLDSDGSIIASRWPTRFGFKILMRVSQLFYDLIISETPCGMEKFIQFLGHKNKLTTIPDGYDQDIFQKIGYSDSKREKIIITASRIDRPKNIESLLRSFVPLANVYPDWNLVIAGKVDDNDYFEELVSFTKANNISERVSFLGHLNPVELRKQYLLASIFVTLSFKESFGIARVEAIASGLPVITSPAGCGEFYGQNGAVLVSPDDNLEITRKLLELIRNEGNREEIVRNLQKIIRSWKEVAKDIVDKTYPSLNCE